MELLAFAGFYVLFFKSTYIFIIIIESIPEQRLDHVHIAQTFLDICLHIRWPF